MARHPEGQDDRPHDPGEQAGPGEQSAHRDQGERGGRDDKDDGERPPAPSATPAVPALPSARAARTARAVVRVQTGVRMEKRLVKVLKALAELYDLSLGDLLEGIVLHAFAGRSPFSAGSLRRIAELERIYGLDPEPGGGAPPQAALAALADLAALDHPAAT
jgi:hypothetical protein